MANWMVILVVGFLVGGAAGYIYKEKKKGARCIGCPHSGVCSGHCASCEQRPF